MANKNDNEKSKEYNEHILTLAINYSKINSAEKEELKGFIRINFFRTDKNENILMKEDIEIYTFKGVSDRDTDKLCEIHMVKPINRHYQLFLFANGFIFCGYKTIDDIGTPYCNCSFNSSGSTNKTGK